MQSKQYRHDGAGFVLIATVRHDDRCNNGHNTFGVTADRYEPRRQPGEPSVLHADGRKMWLTSCGCLHDDVARYFPTLAPLTKWHLCSTDGPLHYLANTLYHASDKDHKGLRAGEGDAFEYHVVVDGAPLFKSRIFYSFRDWLHEPEARAEAEKFLTCVRPELRPEVVRVVLDWSRSKGKPADLEAARSCAIWPDATLEQLRDEEALKARLPALMAEFRAAVESLGFTYY